MSELKQCEKRLKAEEYLRKNHIMELFEDLCTAVAYKQPENLNEFLIKELEQRKEHGIHIPVFTQEEVENIFKLYDLKQEGVISRFKCREALKSMANTQKQLKIAEDFDEIPNKVDLAAFKELCNKVLGVWA
jgi:Ca2+-binding EF-hand superfamily protein